ncbi:hypothetical protein RDI58_013278 [Solanum bulbocastanum]|uniref:RNase H type-1 domain-containing protein n=1 Tax=Solanum bulbocastanum TaxID=147425 RepID=A0AAN8YHK5_SOLBU
MGKFKLNTDGADKHTLGEEGIGGVIRNHKGDWIVGFTSKEAFVTLILAELRALRQGLLMEVEYKTQLLKINTDCKKKMINLLENDNHPHTNLTTECRLLMEKVKAETSTHIFREQNKVANMLNKEGIK